MEITVIESTNLEPYLYFPWLLLLYFGARSLLKRADQSFKLAHQRSAPGSVNSAISGGSQMPGGKPTANIQGGGERG